MYLECCALQRGGGVSWEYLLQTTAGERRLMREAIVELNKTISDAHRRETGDD